MIPVRVFYEKYTIETGNSVSRSKLQIQMIKSNDILISDKNKHQEGKTDYHWRLDKERKR